MVITVLWAELWFVAVRCTLAGSVGIVHILIRVNVGYFRYIEQAREDILVVSATYSTVVVTPRFSRCQRQSLTFLSPNKC
jgi:hypothetical protein